jgi:hypothetical protein
MPKRIVYVTIADDFSAGDVRELDDLILSYIHQGYPPEVHVVIDASQVRTLSPMLATANFRYLRNPHLGWNIFITADRVPKSSQMAITDATGAHCRSFTSLEEGLFFLEDKDASLLMPT